MIRVPLARVKGRGRGDAWELRLDEFASLHDQEGVERAAFLPERAAAEFRLPSFTENMKYLTIPVSGTPLQFAASREGLSYIQGFVRKGLVAHGPEAVARLWTSGVRDLAIGLAMIAAGVAWVLLSGQKGARGALSVIGAAVAGRGIWYLREHARARHLAAGLARPCEEPSTDHTAAAPGRGIPIGCTLLLIVLTAIVLAIVLALALPWFQGPPSRSVRP
jgi:hypothetical protein